MNGARLVAVAMAVCFGLATVELLAYANVSGDITGSVTWGRTSPAADGIYRVTGAVRVMSGGSLTIEPGVIVKFNSGMSLTVGGGTPASGTLNAQGTSLDPILFTSVKNDVRADTNGDGGGSSPAAGDWTRIYFTTGGTGTMDYCQVSYGGQSYSMGVLCSGGAPSQFTNSSISNTNGVGLECASGYGPGTISGCAFSSNTQWPIQIFPAFVSAISASNTFTGNGNNGIYVQSGSLSAAAHAWSTLPVAYYLAGLLTVPTGATLNLGSGCVIKLTYGTVITVNAGTVNARGASGNPVVFTSYRDDAAAGDTNGDGSATSPAAGDWGRVYYSNGGTGVLDHCAFRYYGYNTYAAVDCATGAPSQLTNSTVSESASTGLDCSSGYKPGSVANCTFSSINNWPVRIYASDASVLAASNTFTGIKNAGIYVYGGSLSAASHTWQTLAVPYYLASALTIPSGSTLNLGPGCIVKPAYGTGISIGGGVLNAQGTAGQPVLFTSSRDDSAGGDTNGDGAATSPAAGDWSRLYYTSGGAGILDYCNLRYYGYNNYPALDCYSGAPSLVTNCAISLSSATGLDCANGYRPNSVAANTFQGINTWPVRIFPGDAPVLGSSNAFSGNKNAGVFLSGQTLPAGTFTLNKLAVPYHLSAGLSIPSGATVNLSAGSVLKIAQGVVVTVSGGALNGLGTSGDRVVVTSYRDDSAGGDTNGDGPSGGAPGDWGRIYFTSSGTGSLAHTDFRYGGYNSNDAIHCYSGCFSLLDHCTIRNNADAGVYCEWASSAPTIKGCTIRENARGILVAAGGANPTIGGSAENSNEIYSNTSYGVENAGTVCVNARYNYWGANDGPDDPSSTSDTCMLGANAGGGDRVTNNVDYTAYVGSPVNPPDPPAPSSPTSPSESATATPTLTVTNSPSAGTLLYHFQVARNTAFTQGLQEASVSPGSGTTAWTVPSALNENTTHYWRCRVEDQGTGFPSTWTDTWRFFVNATNEPPSAPVPVSPGNGTRVATANPTLSANNASDPDDNETHDYTLTYEFGIYSDSGCTALVEGQAGITEGAGQTSYTVVGALTENATYWWRVRANDGVQNGGWSGARNFIVNATNDGGPDAPTLYLPANASYTGNTAPSLWVNNPNDVDRDPLTYTFEVYGNLALSDLVASTSSVSGICCSGVTGWGTTPALQRSRWYWWRSNARDASITGPNMATASFLTQGFAMPESGAYGYLPTPGGDLTRPDRVLYTFGGVSGDVTIMFQAYNVPAGLESSLQVLINGVDAGTQGASVPMAWSGTRTIVLPDASVYNSSTNIVTFSNSLNAPGAPTVEWGVRSVGIHVPPPNPATATPYDTVIDVGWTPVFGVSGYNVYRSPVSGGPWTKLNGSLLTASPYRDTNLTNGTAYYYVVRSVNSLLMEGVDSNEVSATPTASGGVTPVTDLRVTKSGGDAELDWTNITTTGGVKHYKIYLVNPGSSPPFTRVGATVLGTPAMPPYSHSGALGDGFVHYYDMATVNNSDQEAGQ
jgi:hypothetical protein